MAQNSNSKSLSHQWPFSESEKNSTHCLCHINRFFKILKEKGLIRINFLIFKETGISEIGLEVITFWLFKQKLYTPIKILQCNKQACANCTTEWSDVKYIFVENSKRDSIVAKSK